MATVFGLASAVLAESSDNTSSQKLFKSGPYVGLSFGYSYQSSSVQEAMAIPNIIGAFDVAPKATVRSNGVTEGITLGYRYMAGSGFMLGADLTGAVNNNEINKTFFIDGQLSARSPLTSRGQIIPAVVLGKQLSPQWLAFLKLGAAINFFTFQHYLVSATGLQVNYGSYKKTSTGFMAAVGGEYALNKEISLLGTVAYLGSGTIKQSYTGDEFFALSRAPLDTTGSTTFKPYYVTATVGLQYKF